jgi:hypothetical protein
MSESFEMTSSRVIDVCTSHDVPKSIWRRGHETRAEATEDLEVPTVYRREVEAIEEEEEEDRLDGSEEVTDWISE